MRTPLSDERPTGLFLTAFITAIIIGYCEEMSAATM